MSEESAVENAIRFVKEGGADAVKLEGAGRTLTRIGAIVDAGIPVMGHIGLTPQSATLLGGYKAQGRTAAAARRLVDEALALERAGCFSLVLEAIPPPVAARITEAVGIPTIGIGAGASCSGQVLVWHDLLGLLPGPRRASSSSTRISAARFAPRSKPTWTTCAPAPFPDERTPTACPTPSASDSRSTTVAPRER